jgi:viologen exporter family transport system permease protein
MNKYFHVLNIGLQNTFVYRWNFLLRCLFSFVPFLGMIYLWSAALGEPNAKLAGYDLANVISYFLALIFLDAVASPTEDDFQIAAEIRDGLINQFLLKPVNYFVYRFCLFWSSRTIYTGVTLLPILCVAFFARQYLVTPLSLEQWLLAAAAAFLSACLQFGIAYCTAMLAFWLLDISAPTFIVFSIEFALGGHMFPLDFMPRPIFEVLRMLPFYYEYFFPLQIFLGKASPQDIANGFIIQIFWVIFFFVLGQAIWKAGLRKYTAVGG